MCAFCCIGKGAAACTDTELNGAGHAGNFAVHVTCELHKYKYLTNQCSNQE